MTLYAHINMYEQTNSLVDLVRPMRRPDFLPRLHASRLIDNTPHAAEYPLWDLLASDSNGDWHRSRIPISVQLIGSAIALISGDEVMHHPSK